MIQYFLILGNISRQNYMIDKLLCYDTILFDFEKMFMDDVVCQELSCGVDIC